MYRPRDPVEGDAAAIGGGVAVSAAGLALPVSAPGDRQPLHPRPSRMAASLTARLGHWRNRAGVHFHRMDLAPDLAEDIGSKRWLRGFGTMLGLCAAALSFWPDFSAVEAATSLPTQSDPRAQYRSQMILPLAMNAGGTPHLAATGLVTPISSAPERAMVQIVAVLGEGDGFDRMLQRTGVSAGDAAQVAAMVSSAVPPGEIAPGTRFAITLGKREAAGRPRPLSAIDFRARFDLDLVIARRGGALALERRPIAVDAAPLRIRGTVGPSLYRSARAAGAPVKAIEQYLQALDAHINLEGDVAPGDSFDIVVAHKRSANGESETGELLFAGLERDGKPLAQLLRWGVSGRSGGQFYDAAQIASGSAGETGGGAMQGGSLSAPVNGHITSGYGMRFHPILGYARMHAGIDFGAAWGSPIHAVRDGIVSFAGHHGGHGNYIRLEHGGGMGTDYGHMSGFAVSPGSRVRAGQIIGYVGSTGLSTGPHLHFEVYRNGQTVNPLSVNFASLPAFAAAPAAVDAKQLAAFKAKLAAIKALTPGAALGGAMQKPAFAKPPLTKSSLKD